MFYKYPSYGLGYRHANIFQKRRFMDFNIALNIFFKNPHRLANVLQNSKMNGYRHASRGLWAGYRLANILQNSDYGPRYGLKNIFQKLRIMV